MERESRPSHLTIQLRKIRPNAKNPVRRSFFYYPGPKPRVLWIKMDKPSRKFIPVAVALHRNGYSFKNTTEYDLTQIA